MSDFIDKFKKGLKSKAPAAPTGSPIFLTVGSLAGVTRKDAMQYARGLAESNVISPELARLQVTEDKLSGRFIYEIHEGGVQTAIAEKVVEALTAGKPVRIALANDAFLTIEESHGELFTLIHPAPDPAEALLATPRLEVVDGVEVEVVEPVPDDVALYAGAVPLLELFPEQRHLFKAGVVLMAATAVIFVTTGLLFGLKQAGWLDKDALLLLTKAGHTVEVSDNPAWQLEKARNAADKAGTHIKALKKGPQGWSWELAQ